MNIVEVAEQLLTYLKVNNGNRRTQDAVEESIELLQRSDLSEEQKSHEINRIGEVISFLVEKETENDSRQSEDTNAKQLFADGIKRRLEDCRQETLSMAERKALEQTDLIQGFENEFRSKMNTTLNGKLMTERENFLRLVSDELKNLQASLRSVVKEFTKSVMDEVESCVEKIRKDFVSTEIPDYHISHQEMDVMIMTNYDTMQKNLLTKAENYLYPAEQFDKFASETGEKMEKLAGREKRVTGIWKLLPLIIYIIKYIIDTYVLSEESLFDKLMNIIVEWLNKKLENNTAEDILEVLRVIVTFIQENGEGAFELTMHLVLLFLFAGWLYYIYIKIVTKVRSNSLYRKQQAIMTQDVECFLKELDIQCEIKSVLKDMEMQVTESYMQKHSKLFEKLVVSSVSEETENSIGRLQRLYLECIGNGGI